MKKVEREGVGPEVRLAEGRVRSGDPESAAEEGQTCGRWKVREDKALKGRSSVQA